MTFEQQWIEYDYNPFILFNSNGKIISLNTQAQFLLGSASPLEIFELAKTYASVTFGFKTTFLDIKFDRYKFFGLSVGYENEDEIGIRLYQLPSLKPKTTKPHGKITNIYTLVDLCISTNSINSDTKFTKEFDPTIPQVVIDSNEFVKILTKSYECFPNTQEINTKIFYRVGEYIKFEDKKYTLFCIEIKGDKIDEAKSLQIQEMAQNSAIYIDIDEKISINIPIITQNTL